ncbi:MAG: hypothetical protein AAF810_20870 [Cyanobacteria bacterium P01_D01_bin.36]
MDINDAIATADNILFTASGHHLTDLERAVLRGSLQGRKYDAIAKQTHQSQPYIKDIGSLLWRKLAKAIGEDCIKKGNIKSVLERYLLKQPPQLQQSPQPSTKQSRNKPKNSTKKLLVPPSQDLPSQAFPSIDWADAPEFATFFGRENELATLRQWILQERCRLISIVGMKGIGKTGLTIRLGLGGVGKTNLSLQLVRGIQDEFDYVIWRSLLNAPPIEDTLGSLVRFLSNQQETELPDSLDANILTLLGYLKRQRCLLILDNVESILMGDTSSPPQGHRLRSSASSSASSSVSSGAGQYREGYEAYGQLFQKIGEVHHQSCLLLTSREKPKNLQTIANDQSKIRLFPLSGLKDEDAKKIFGQNYVLPESGGSLEKIIHFYEGNPLALNLVLKRIQNIFNGDIADFLAQDDPFFEDINELLDWHFVRMNSVEQEILYWLAINREPTSVSVLKYDCLPLNSLHSVTNTLDSLRLRLPINIARSGFVLQPVIIEYLTNKLIKTVCDEIQSGNINWLNRICLQKGLAKTYIRETQNRLILIPLANRLIHLFSRLSIVVQKLNATLDCIKNTPEFHTGYATGNLISLLCTLNVDLAGYDFSALTIRQAYLQDISLKNVNFSHADLSTAVFTQSFGGIHSSAFSPDNQYLAVGDSKGQIQLLQSHTHQLVRQLTGHAPNLWITALAFAKTRPLLASCSFDRTVKLWNFETGECLHTLTGHMGWLWGIAISPDGCFIASSGDDCTIRIWDSATGECLHVLTAHSNWVWTVAFSPDGKTLASGSYDCTIRLWDIESGDCLHILKGHEKSVWSVAFSPDGTTLVSGSLDYTVRLWSIANQQCLHLMKGHAKEVRSVAFAPDGKSVISGSFDSTLRCWNVATGRCITTYLGHRVGIRTVAISPDGQVLASGDHSQCLRVWKYSTGHCLRIIKGHSNWVWSVDLAPDQQIDQQTIVSGGLDGVIRLWRLSTGECYQLLEGHENWIWQVRFHPNGKILASCSDDETIKLWEVKSGRCFKTLKGHGNGGVWAIDFSPNGKWLISGGQDGTIRRWNVASAQCMQVIQAHDNWIWSVVFNYEGSLFASCSDDGAIKLWDADTNSIKYVLNNQEKVAALQWLNNKNILASGHDSGLIKLWDVSTGKLLKVLEGHQALVLSLQWLADDNTLLSSAQDNTIRFWNICEGTCTQVLTEHQNWVTSISISHKNNLAVTGSADETLKIWDIETKECLRSIKLPRPYDGMDLTDAVGLQDSRKEGLKFLGAIV